MFYQTEYAISSYGLSIKSLQSNRSDICKLSSDLQQFSYISLITTRKCLQDNFILFEDCLNLFRDCSLANPQTFKQFDFPPIFISIAHYFHKNVRLIGNLIKTCSSLHFSFIICRMHTLFVFEQGQMMHLFKNKRRYYTIPFQYMF